MNLGNANESRTQLDSESAINSALLHLTNRYLMTKHSHTQIHHAHTHTHNGTHTMARAAHTSLSMSKCQSKLAHTHAQAHTQPQSRGAKHNNPGHFQDLQDLQPFCMPRPRGLAFMMFRAVRSKQTAICTQKTFPTRRGVCARGVLAVSLQQTANNLN